MNVQELIDELSKIEAKELEVVIHTGVRFSGLRKVSEKEIQFLPMRALKDSYKKAVFLHRKEIT